MLIDINGLLPKDLDLAMITRDASFAPPTPETYDSGDATAQAAKNSTEWPRPFMQTRQGRRVTTEEAYFATLT